MITVTVWYVLTLDARGLQPWTLTGAFGTRTECERYADLVNRQNVTDGMYAQDPYTLVCGSKIEHVRINR